MIIGAVQRSTNAHWIMVTPTICTANYLYSQSFVFEIVTANYLCKQHFTITIHWPSQVFDAADGKWLHQWGGWRRKKAGDGDDPESPGRILKQADLDSPG